MKLGVYLLKFDEKDPMDFSFILKVKNGLEIADADI